MAQGNMWVDSLWITRKESLSIDGISRETSVGMSIKNDYRAATTDIYDKADKALNRLLEEEKERWLNQETMVKERDSVFTRIKKQKEKKTNGGESDEETIK